MAVILSKKELSDEEHVNAVTNIAKLVGYLVGFSEAIESLRAFADIIKEAGRVEINHVLEQAIECLKGKLKEKEIK